MKRITNEVLFEKLKNMHNIFDVKLANLEKGVNRINGSVDEHKKRIVDLELWKSNVKGKVTGISWVWKGLIIIIGVLATINLGG